jgi:hypothetical protein
MQKGRVWKKCRKDACGQTGDAENAKRPPLEKAEEHHIGLWMQESKRDFFV